jgi:thiamine-phosphate pyrophosphorylase
MNNRRHSARLGSHAEAMGTMVSRREGPRLYLVTPPLGDAGAIADDLAAALNAANIAAVLLRLADAEERALVERIEALRILVQSNGAALLLDGHPALVGRTQVDGAHLAGIEAFKAAAPALKPKAIAGCGALATRDEAMRAGESGADYVMFGEPNPDGSRPRFEAVLDRVAWWADVMVIPCVAYAAALDEVAPLAQAGAEFVAVGEDIWRSNIRAALDALAQAGVPEPAR